MPKHSTLSFQTPHDPTTEAADAGAAAAVARLAEQGLESEYVVCIAAAGGVAGVGTADIEADSEHDSLMELGAILLDNTAAVLGKLGLDVKVTRPE